MTKNTILCALIALIFTSALAVPVEQEKAVEITPAKEIIPESPQTFGAVFQSDAKLAEQQPVQLPAEVPGGNEPADLANSAEPQAEGSDLETANTFWGYGGYGGYPYYGGGHRGYGGGWRRGWGSGWGGGWGGGYGGYGGYGGWGGYNRGYGGWGRGYGGGGWRRGWGWGW